MEEMLAGIWSELLGIDQVGVEDDFFELGGHSLLATQAVSRIRQAFRVEMPLRMLFEKPTIAETARQINAQILMSGLLKGRATPCDSGLATCFLATRTRRALVRSVES